GERKTSLMDMFLVSPDWDLMFRNKTLKGWHINIEGNYRKTKKIQEKLEKNLLWMGLIIEGEDGINKSYLRLKIMGGSHINQQHLLSSYGLWQRIIKETTFRFIYRKLGFSRVWSCFDRKIESKKYAVGM
ncbi:hypothetical protein ACJX0J_032093, partial [Zea mays]